MISVIIPAYNEADQIERTIRKIRSSSGEHEIEIIVVDGGSTDKTVSIAEKCGAILLKECKGRATQMNKGASASRGEILYFLHADSIPPVNFADHISNSLLAGAVSGCFRLAFDYDHWFLKANCWFTRFNVNVVRFGDQSLYVLKNIFFQSGGFREDHLLMADQEIIHRIKKHGKFKVMDASVITSARKYLDNGIFRTQAIFFLIWFLYYMGYTQNSLMNLHRKLVRKHNND